MLILQLTSTQLYCLFLTDKLCFLFVGLLNQFIFSLLSFLFFNFWNRRDFPLGIFLFMSFYPLNLPNLCIFILIIWKLVCFLFMFSFFRFFSSQFTTFFLMLIQGGPFKFLLILMVDCFVWILFCFDNISTY